MKNKKVYSLGHSNLELNEFIDVLKKFNIRHLLDVRSVPKSSYVSHFNKEKLEKELKQNDITYTYCGDNIGGRQHIDFKDYVNTPKYESSIKMVERIIKRGESAIMCSEKDFTKCHRKYICNTLIENGFDVIQVDVQNSKKNEKQMSLGGYK